LFSDTRVTLESSASEARTHCNIIPIVQKLYNYNTTLYKRHVTIEDRVTKSLNRLKPKCVSRFLFSFDMFR